MSDVGYATLDIIPSLKGLQAELDRQSRGPLAAAGRTGGKVFGVAAAQGAGTSFVPRFQNGAKTLEVAGRTGGRAYGQTAGKEAGSSFTDLFQRETKTFGSAGIAGGKAFGTSAGREAAGGFVSLFRRQVQAPIIVAGQAGGQAYGAAAGDQAGSSFAETFQSGLQGSDLIAGAGIADLFQDSIADVGNVGQEAGEEFSEGAADGLGKLQGLLAGVGIAGVLKSLVDDASAAEQSVGGVGAVFGEYAASVEDASARAAAAFGLSATSYQELVTVSGALLKNKGLSDYADQAQTLIQTGADLAATFGGTTADAVGALNAALRGESDPIERYAISLNETAVNARLAASGQSKLTGAALDQAKITARLAIIQQQSADSAGAAARESDTFASKSAQATAKLANLRAELGANLLPVSVAVTSAFSDKLIPALSGAGGVAVELGRDFATLPDPVKTAALAFVALRVASAAGLTTAAANIAGTVASAFTGLYSRVLLTSTAFTAARANAGIFQSGLVGLRAGAVGTGAALGTLASSLAPVVAITAAISIYSKFKQSQQEVKDRVDALAASLDAQSGAVTENTKEIAAKTLEDSGVLKNAEKLGISLGTITDAYLGNTDALALVKSQMGDYDKVLTASNAGAGAYTQAQIEQARAAKSLSKTFFDMIGDTDSAVASQKRQIEAAKNATATDDDLAAATSKVADATGDSINALDDYTKQVNDARSALSKLIDAEKERKDALSASLGDRISLQQQIADTRKEAREGPKGLDKNRLNSADRDNLSALKDLADQFNNSQGSVRNAPGLYEKVRAEFIKSGIEAGGARKHVAELADELIRLPKSAALRLQTPGLADAITNVRELTRELERFQRVAERNSFARLNNGAPGDLAGLVPGRGGDSDVTPRQRRRDGARAAELGTMVDEALGVSGRSVSGDSGRTIYQYNGPVTYTDEEQGRRRAKQMDRRSHGDGVRRP